MLRLFLVLNFLTVSAFCEEVISSENQEISKAINQISYEPNWFGLLFGLLMVIALIYFTGFIYQKMIKVNLSNRKLDDIRADILSTTSLGQGRNLHVVKVGDKNILIGATQNNITYIADVGNIKTQGGANVTKNC